MKQNWRQALTAVAQAQPSWVYCCTVDSSSLPPRLCELGYWTGTLKMLGLELRASCVLCIALPHSYTPWPSVPSCCLRAGEDYHLPKVTERTWDNQEVLFLDLQGDSSVLVLILHDWYKLQSVVFAFLVVLTNCLTETLNREQIYFGSQFESESCYGGQCGSNVRQLSPCVYSKEAERGRGRRRRGKRREREMLVIAEFLLFIQSTTPARGMVLSVFRMCLSTSVKLL